MARNQRPVPPGPTRVRKPVSLVTGGAGFLGSHLVDLLLERGHTVVVLDNLITGSLRNLAHINSPSRFKFIQHDLINPIRYSGRIDHIWHLASPASPFDYMAYPIETLRVGAEGTRNALELARSKKASLLLASTSEVYGDPVVHPQTEAYWGNVNSIGPRSCYDEAKRFAEALVMAYRREYGVETRIVRIFNTYGPRMRLMDGRVVPAFIGQALTGKNLTVFGKGDQTRSFCYCSDLIEGLFRLMFSGYPEPVNIGNPEQWTIRDFAREIIRATGSKSKIIHQPLPQDDPKQRQPDIRLARKLLDWQPSVPLSVGIQKTIEYFQGLPNPESTKSSKRTGVQGR